MGKNADDRLTPEQHRERDAKALQEKTAKKAAQLLQLQLLVEA
ncbi:unnamed protein product [Brassica rapa subsp. narinosa]